jgi:hypothetical protein
MHLSPQPGTRPRPTPQWPLRSPGSPAPHRGGTARHPPCVTRARSPNGSCRPGHPSNTHSPAAAPATARPDAHYAAEAGVHTERWRCINIRPGRLPARPWPGLLTVRRALDNRAPTRRYGRFLTAGSLRLWPRIKGSVRPLRAVGSVFGWRNRRDGRGDPAGFVPHSGPALDVSVIWLCVRGGEAGLQERGGLRKPGVGSHRAVRGMVASAGPGAQVDQAGTGLVPRRRPPARWWCLASMRLPLYLAMNNVCQSLTRCGAQRMVEAQGLAHQLGRAELAAFPASQWPGGPQPAKDQ